ncbi:hypothetical protein BV25DRAFT_1843788, partial [Artomyces pyxidatus]
HCVGCLDGGLSVDCDWCARTWCSPSCIEFPTEDLERYLFVCPTCHIQVIDAADPVHPGKRRRGTPYMGLYRKGPGERVEAFPGKPLVVKATPQLGAAARLSVEPITVINIRLAGIEGAGHPAILAHTALVPYFTLTRTPLLHTLDFNLEDEKDVKAHATRVKRMITKMKKNPAGRVVVFLTTHSHDETGDLSCCKPAFASRVLHFVDLIQFFDMVVTKPLLEELKGKETTFFLFACGGLARNRTSMGLLQEQAKANGIDNLLMFDALKFSLHITAPFVLDYTLRVLLGNAPVERAMAPLLESCWGLNTHCRVIRMALTQGVLTTTVYFFHHRRSHPWGQALPFQCSDCKALKSLTVDKHRAHHMNPAPVTAVCEGTKGDGTVCGKTLTFDVPSYEYTRLRTGHAAPGGDWLAADYDDVFRAPSANASQDDGDPVPSVDVSAMDVDE